MMLLFYILRENIGHDLFLEKCWNAAASFQILGDWTFFLAFIKNGGEQVQLKDTSSGCHVSVSARHLLSPLFDLITSY